MSKTPPQPTASQTYTNWQRSRLGQPCQETTEAILFTNTWITGDIPSFGPYAFINTIAQANAHPSKTLLPAVVMRVGHHYEGTPHGPSAIPMKNDFEHYHGGDFFDEMAALVSLFLGVRFKAGGANRIFRGNEDRFGRPIQYGGKVDPQLLLERRVQIPRLQLPTNLDEGLQALASFPDRTVAQTNALIKAARQYQQAIWIGSRGTTRLSPSVDCPAGIGWGRVVRFAKLSFEFLTGSCGASTGQMPCFTVLDG